MHELVILSSLAVNGTRRAQIGSRLQNLSCIQWQRRVNSVLQLLDAALHPDESSYGIGSIATNPHPVTIVWVPDP